MAVTITLSPETEKVLRRRAAERGQTLERYLEQLAERDALHRDGNSGAPEPTPRAGATFAEILAPLHQEFRESGMTEEELDALIEECRQEVWNENQARQWF